jgi:Patatin-like phospholipase
MGGYWFSERIMLNSKSGAQCRLHLGYRALAGKRLARKPHRPRRRQIADDMPKEPAGRGPIRLEDSHLLGLKAPHFAEAGRRNVCSDEFSTVWLRPRSARRDIRRDLCHSGGEPDRPVLRRFQAFHAGWARLKLAPAGLIWSGLRNRATAITPSAGDMLMNRRLRSTLSAATALAVTMPLLLPAGFVAPARAQAVVNAASGMPRLQLVTPARAKHKAPAKTQEPEAPPPAPNSSDLPPRVDYTAAEAVRAAIPGMPDARFWSDSVADFKAALPSQAGPWLILSSGGADGAFGAGLLNGLTAGGKRPDYAVVSGVSTGALMAPFAFAGKQYDEALHKCYTEITAADVFEAGSSTGESFVNSWPLRDFINKQMTPELMADIAAAHRSGRRLFIVTSDLDSQRSVVWNMGAIAAHGGDDAVKLFRKVLLASASIPGGFPPVMIDVEADGKRFQEMHVDGGLGGQFFVAPPSLMASTSDYRLPATQLYIIVNTGLQREFKVVDRFAPMILTQSIGMAVPVDTSLMLDRAYIVAKRSDIDFNVASIPSTFSAPSRGPFDPNYMKALYQVGFDQGSGATAFAVQPPPPPSGPVPQVSHIQKTGANQ